MLNLQLIRQIEASDVIGWVLAFIGGAILFKLVDRFQTTIQRHEVIKEIEELINNFFSKDIAIVYIDGKKVNVSIRTVLDNRPWHYEKNQVKIIEDKRYVKIRENEYISTQALHESLIIFRRIEKIYKDKILKPIDLVDLWREILPFATEGRIKFYESYFGSEDIQPITFVIFNTILACAKFNVKDPINYFYKYYNKDIDKYFCNNNRYRIIEKIKINKFRKIVKYIKKDNINTLFNFRIKVDSKFNQ